MKRAAFPKEIFVKIENEGSDDQYFATAANAAEHAEVGEDVRVGIYRLVLVAKVKTDTKVV